MSLTKGKLEGIMVPRIYWQSPPFSSLASGEKECGLLMKILKKPEKAIKIGIWMVIVL
jgi:hypothetical protein